MGVSCEETLKNSRNNKNFLNSSTIFKNTFLKMSTFHMGNFLFIHPAFEFV